jgi:Tfp pilus assembly protein PilO
MSTVSSREKTMLLVAVVAALYAMAALSYKKQAANWKAAERLYRSAQKKVLEERALIAARDEWTDRYEQMRDLMPVFPYEQDVDTHWLNIMDAAATRNGLTISRRQTGKEAEVGDVYELPVECKGWEGTLESLVKFLYDLQKAGAMLDVRQLFVQPVLGKPGILKGTFTLTCAYMRGEAAKAVKAPGADAGLPTLSDAPLASVPLRPKPSAETEAGPPGAVPGGGAPEDQDATAGGGAPPQQTPPAAGGQGPGQPPQQPPTSLEDKP